MSRSFSRRSLAVGLALALVALPALAAADHAWGPYHWARTSNPFTLKVGDNVSGAWEAVLDESIADWNASSVLNLTEVAGGTRVKPCKGTTGRVEVCSAGYGFTGWLGLAQIWITGGEHITKGVVKVNDTYHNSAPYNSTAWRSLVMCQEIGHTFGLDHQDENFDNANLGTCMDYTSDPDGPLSNEDPNAHDFAQLEAIYAHLDNTTTVGMITRGGGNAAPPANWGRQIRTSSDGRTSLFVADLGRGQQVFTFVTWAH